jgi:hypothetical protein
LRQDDAKGSDERNGARGLASNRFGFTHKTCRCTANAPIASTFGHNRHPRAYIKFGIAPSEAMGPLTTTNDLQIGRCASSERSSDIAPTINKTIKQTEENQFNL